MDVFTSHNRRVMRAYSFAFFCRSGSSVVIALDPSSCFKLHWQECSINKIICRSWNAQLAPHTDDRASLIVQFGWFPFQDRFVHGRDHVGRSLIDAITDHLLNQIVPKVDPATLTNS